MQASCGTELSNVTVHFETRFAAAGEVDPAIYIHLLLLVEGQSSRTSMHYYCT
jgi:hypothetical protein